jgi:hypothetical protein
MRNFRKFMILAEAGDLLGGGGGNPDPAPANPAPGNPAPASKVSIPDNWKEALDADLLDNPSIKSIKDINALAKSFIHGQKLVGADKIVVPSNLTSEEEWKGIYQKLGMPESAEKYEFNVGGETNKEFIGKFKSMALGAGILPKQAEKLFSFFENESKSATSASEASAKAEFDETVNGLKKEWGQAYDRKLSNAAGLFTKFADEDTKKFMKESGFSNNPAVLKLMSKIADSFGEDTFVAPGGDGAMGMTPQEAADKISAIYKDISHPYFHKNHPKNGEAKAEMARLQLAKINRKN